MVRLALALSLLVSRPHEQSVAEARAELSRLRAERERDLRTAEDALTAARRARTDALAAAELNPPARGRRLELLARAMSRELAARLAMDEPRGCLVAKIRKAGAGYAAGLRAGDVVLRFDGRTVSSPKQLSALVAASPRSREIEVEVWRDRRALVVVLPAVDELGRIRSQHDQVVAAARERIDQVRRTYDVRLLAAEERLRQCQLALRDAELPTKPPPAAAARRREPPRAHLFPTLAFDREQTQPEPEPSQREVVAAAPVRRITEPYIQTDVWKRVFVDLEEFLAWHTAHGKASQHLGATAFDFHDAVDGGRVRIGSRDQECFVFDKQEPFERFAVPSARSYYNVKCHDEGAIVF